MASELNVGKIGIGLAGGGAPSTQLTIECNTTGEAIADGIRIQNVRGIANDIAPMYFGVHGGVKRAKAAIGLKRIGDYGIGELRFAVDSNGDDADVSFATDTKMAINSAGAVIINNAGGDAQIYLGGSSGTSRMYLSRGGVNASLWNVDAGSLRFGTNDNERLSINSAGTTWVSADGFGSGYHTGADASLAPIHNGSARPGIRIYNINDGTAIQTAIDFKRNGTSVGGIFTTNAATSYATSSDYRLKENVSALTGALDRLDSIPVYNFNFKTDPTKTVDGFLAHEVAEFVPEAITGTKDEMQTVVTTEAVEAVEAVAATLYVEGDELPEGKAIGDEKTPAVEAVEAVAEVTEEQPKYQGIDQSKLVPLMLAAIKELKAKVTALENA